MASACHQLTPREEVELARRIAEGDADAKDEMVVANVRLFHAIARKYRGRGVSYEDLVQEGFVGLMHAVERFDHRRGLKFSTYAVWWIRRSVMDAVADATTIRVPHRARRQLAAVHRAGSDLRRSGATATDDAIARRAGLPERTVHWLREAPRVFASLDEPVGEDGTSLGELIAASDEDGPTHTVEELDRARAVRTLLGLLPARQREVVVRRYGLIGHRTHTHDEIGALLGVGEERSRQLEREALHRLRSLGPVGHLAA